MDDLFNALVHHTRAVIDRHGEAHISCPECGKESSPRDPHCSFNKRGWHCFVCGEGGSLKDLAERINLDAGEYRPPQPVQKANARKEQPSWMANPDPILATYEAHPRRIELWQAYKRLPEELITEKCLGVGVLPASRCKHERLVVPVFSGTMCVGLRGRAISCDCPKWLASAGWSLDLVPLYNADAISQDQVLWITENPVDALMVGLTSPFTGVATYSTSYWREAWTETLAAARPELVVVAFDHDLPGNGGGPRRDEFAGEWLQTHPRVPKPRGVLLVNHLLAAGLPARLFDWAYAPYKADIGSMLTGVIL